MLPMPHFLPTRIKLIKGNPVIRKYELKRCHHVRNDTRLLRVRHEQMAHPYIVGTKMNMVTSELFAGRNGEHPMFVMCGMSATTHAGLGYAMGANGASVIGVRLDDLGALT